MILRRPWLSKCFFLHGSNNSITVQTIPSLKAVLEGPDQVGIAYTHTVDYICIDKGVQIKPELQHTRKWSAAAWPPSRLCYCPADSSRHLCVIVLSIPKVKIWCAFKKTILFQFFFLFPLFFNILKIAYAVNCVTGNCVRLGVSVVATEHISMVCIFFTNNDSYPDHCLPQVSVPIGNTWDSDHLHPKPAYKHEACPCHSPSTDINSCSKKKISISIMFRGTLYVIQWMYYSSDSQHMAPCTSLFAPTTTTTNSKQPYT